MWAGEFVELSTLLPESRSTNQEVSLGLQPQREDGTSVVCYGPKAKPGITYFTQWTKALRISLYLSQTIHYHEAPQMCKYMCRIIMCKTVIYLSLRLEHPFDWTETNMTLGENTEGESASSEMVQNGHCS